MRTKTSILLGLAALLFLMAGAAAAEDEYTFVFTFEEDEALELEGGVTVSVFTQRGFAVFDDPDHPLHMAAQNCYGTQVISAEGSVGSGYCTTVPTGETGGIWAAWEGDQDGGTWHVMRGAGTLEGMTGSGTYSATGGQWADGKGYNRVKGTFKQP